MNNFGSDTLIYLLLDGYVQAVLAGVMACTLLPLLAWVTRWSYPRLARRFFLFNLFLLGWGIPGNVLWLHLTADRFRVADDAPVWAPFLPPAHWVFDHAGGGRRFWELTEGTTFPQLYRLWVATALPVWLLAGLSLLACVRWMKRPARAD